MSNSNNPFLPNLTEESSKNENNDQSNNNKTLDVSAKILEEAPPNAAPPPAYEDVVKPQPTLPAYDFQYNSPQNNQSYLPPPFSSPTENYNQSNIPVNSNRKRGRGGHRGCCCCCFSNQNRNKNCGCGWIIAFVAFIILTTISVANNNACRKLPVGDIQNFSFDPTNTVLDINVDNARIRGGEVRIFQGQLGQQLVNIEVRTGTKGVTPKFDTLTQNGIYELIISQTSGFSIFNIPPRCMKMQINVYLPLMAPSTIRVKDLNIIMSNNGINFGQSINLITEDGNILFNYTSADKISIKSIDGNIGGVITSLANELSISTDDGNVGLFLQLAPGVNDAKINLDTDDGNVDLRFKNSFLGTYDILSRDGNIRINDDNNRLVNENHVIGNISNGGNYLNITTIDGNVGVLF